MLRLALSCSSKQLASYHALRPTLLFSKPHNGFFNWKGGQSELDEIQNAKLQAMKDLGVAPPPPTPQKQQQQPTTSTPHYAEQQQAQPSQHHEQQQQDKEQQTSFVDKMQLLEERTQFEEEKSYGFLKIPLLLVSASLFIFYKWQTAPYSEVFKHATLSEYIPREQHYHAIFAGALSLMNEGNMIVYGPAMVYSLFLCSRVMSQKHIALLFATNALLTAGVTFYYERNKGFYKGTNMVTPKSHGAVTPLAFMSAFFAINPKYCMLKVRALPFLILPAIYFMYECYEFNNVYVNEVSRPAHITAMAYGLIYGLIFKRLI